MIFQNLSRARVALVSHSQWRSSSYFIVVAYINELFIESDSDEIHSTLETGSTYFRMTQRI